MKRVAIFVDYENIRKEIGQIQSFSRDNKFNVFRYNDSRHLEILFKSFLNKDEEIYRIYLYTAKPKSREEILEILSKKKNGEHDDEYKRFKTWNSSLDKTEAFDRAWTHADNSLKSVQYIENVWLRLGETQVKGVGADGYPNLVQKQVDMLIGLDMSRVSFLKHADTILLFSKDSDIAPALNVARENGLNTAVANIEENGNFWLSGALREAADQIRNRPLPIRNLPEPISKKN